MLYLIAIFVGALIGATSESAFGVFAGGVLGWLLVRVSRQQRDIGALRESLAALRAGDAMAAAPAAVSPEVDVASPGLAEVPAVATNASVDEPVTSVVPASPLAEAAAFVEEQRAGPDTVPMPEAPPAHIATPMPVAAATPSPLEPLRRWLVGGNTIVKAGVAILFIGLAFLAKYAAEHTQVPVEWRLAAIGAAAVVLLGFGWRLRLSRPGYAQVLQGGAVAVLYLTLFAAFRFYGVLAAGPAFALMVAVAMFAAALAVLQDARSLAVIGALGGFATPLIVSTGSDNATALFAYYLVLDAGIAAVAWHRTWRSLNLIGFVATFVVATAWGVLRYRPESFAMSEAFLIAFFLLFVLIMLLPARRAAAGAGHRSDAWVNSTLLFGLPTIVFALQYGLVRDTPYGTALSALGLAAFYVFLATTMKKRPELGITFDASLAIATVFLTLVIPFALDERSTAGAWTLEAAGLVWLGFRQRRMLPRAFGYILFVLAGGAMLFAHERFGVPTAIFNAYLFNGLMAGAAAIAGAYFVHRQRDNEAMKAGEEVAEPLLIALATLWLVSTAGVEISAFVPWQLQRSASLVSASGILLLYVLLAHRLAWPNIAWPAVAQAPLLLVGAAVVASVVGHPLKGGGAWAWPIAFAVHALVLRLAAPRWPDPVVRAVHAAGFIALALLGALLGRAITADWGNAESAWPWLGWLVAPAVLLLLLARPATAGIWPVRAAPAAYVQVGGAVLAAGLWLWTLVANVASDGTAAPLPHLPLINPLDIGIALALVAILLWRRSAGEANRALLGAVVAAGFVWLNAMLVRAFHHYGDVPYRIDAWLGSLAVQSGIALLWSLTALVAMWLGARRAERMPWVVGAALLAAVVLKLILVDLSGTGTVTRIVSFIGVGVLMLVIGYVAPLPAKEARHASA
ncbi:MAG: DUF2339 domain-containing protein [Burkholderiales bacterium]|nr:DUF2339 domain-containing protein [Burkholderiales bacterium]